MTPRPALALLALAIGNVPAIAQAPRPLPKLHRLLTTGGQAGRTVEVVVGGADLGTVEALWFSGPGITATPVVGKPATFRVAIDPKHEPKVVDVRVVNREGVSNPRAFVVGDRLESNEVEPNDTPGGANPVALNSVVNGSIAATDVDCFAIDGKAGRRVIIDLSAERIDSKLDATIRLLDARGVEIAESRDEFGADPILDVVLPADGRYVVKLHDVTYAGSPDHFYRLAIHDGPLVVAVLPAILGPGRQGHWDFVGRNLDGSTTRTIGPIGDASGLSLFATGSTIAIRGAEVSSVWNGRRANTFVVGSSIEPVVTEHEPNGPATPQEIRPPCSVGGAFEMVGDLDTYRFDAKKGETWRIEAIAEGIGSIADPTFVVQGLGSGEPADLATADDTPDPGLAPRLNLASVDASLSWKAPSDGRYQVVLGDVATASRGGPRLYYRLTFRRERPDFRLFLLPATPNALDSLGLRPGGRGTAAVVAWRREGFNAPIWVRAESLPDGVRCPPIVIPPGQSIGTIAFEADPKAVPTVGRVGLVGFASTREASPLLRPFNAWLRPDRVEHATPVATIWPLQRGNPNSKATVAPFRATRGFAVSVRDGSSAGKP